MIFDTDVLIWAFCGNDYAIAAIDGETDRKISAVTYMELMKGARNKDEFREIKRYLTGMGFHTVQLNEEISSRAATLIEELSLKSDIGMADALIFATALQTGDVLLSGTYHPFKDVPNLTAKRFSPYPKGKSENNSTFETH